MNDLLWPDGRWMPIGIYGDTMMWLWFRAGTSLGPAQSIIRGARAVWLEVAED